MAYCIRRWCISGGLAKRGMGKNSFSLLGKLKSEEHLNIIIIINCADRLPVVLDVMCFSR